MPRLDPLHERVDELLAPHRAALARDEAGYTGHVHRVTGLVLAQARGRLGADERELIAVAAVYHDLGIWLDGTFDYLAPSIGHAAAQLTRDGRPEAIPRVSRIIDRHHQLRPVRDDALVEAFRRADLADVSLGRLTRGIPAGTWPELRRRWPIAGFHLRLLVLAARQARREPLRPLPMLRW